MSDVATYAQVIEPPLRRTVQVLSTLCPHWSVRSTTTHTNTNTDTLLNILDSSFICDKIRLVDLLQYYKAVDRDNEDIVVHVSAVFIYRTTDGL